MLSLREQEVFIGLNMKRSGFRFMNIVSLLRIESACLCAYSFHTFG